MTGSGDGSIARVAVGEAAALWSAPMTTDAPAADRTGLPYRPCVGIALINRAGLVLVGRRRGGAATGAISDAHAWQMPQGGIDPGEAPLAAALRELREETNVREDSVTLLGEAPDWLAYDLPPELQRQTWKRRYRGQAQKWFAFGFLGEDGEIDVLAPGGAHRSEFDAWLWVPMTSLPGLVIPFKRQVYDRVVAAFSGLTTWRASV